MAATFAVLPIKLFRLAHESFIPYFSSKNKHNLYAMEQNIYVKEAYAALTADGNAQGYVTVASAAPFYPGATAYVTSDTVESLQCIISEVDSTNNRIYLRAVRANGAGPMYGYARMNAYLLADNARIYMEAGMVPLMAPSTIVKKDHV
jgi:hypothetical protein